MVDVVGYHGVDFDVVQIHHFQSEFSLASKLGSIAATPNLRVFLPICATIAPMLKPLVDYDVNFTVSHSLVEFDFLTEYIQTFQEAI